MTNERAITLPQPLTTTEVLQGLATVQSVLAPDLNPDELRLFAMVASRSGLDPFAKQIYAVKRKGRVTFQTGIDGYRSIAARTGMYDGQDEPEYGAVCACDGKPSGHPESVTVRVYRKGVTRAIAATAFWHEYKPEDNDFMWQRMPRVMIAKVAEALALRKAFPYDPERREGIGADVYTADEMQQAEPVEERPTTARERLAARRAEREAPEAPAPPETAQDEPVEGFFTEDEAPPLLLSKPEFVARLTEAGITPEHAKTVRLALFPDPSHELEDADRGVLWLRLAAEKEAREAVPA